MTTARKIGNASMFSVEVMAVAPADAGIERLSIKYRDLRRELLAAVINKAWGVRINLTSKTEEESNKLIRNLIDAGNTWQRSIRLKKQHGLVLKSHYKKEIVGNDYTAVIDLYFDEIDSEE